MNLRFCSPGRILPYLFYFSLLYLLLWCWKPARAQSVAAYKPLKIGDKVPDVTINNILYYKTQTAKLSDFKGKLLILDFWATWCKPCVAMIPRIDSLQKKYDGQVQFLAVTYQSEKEINAFNEKYTKRTGLRVEVPVVVSDTVLKRLFYHNAIPHYVWIDQFGVVKAITELDQVTDQNLLAMLESKKEILPEKKDIPRLAYDKESTTLLTFLTARQNGLEGQIMQHSFFTPYIQGLNSEYKLIEPVPGEDGNWRITFTNTAPIWIMRIAFGKGKQFLSDNTVSLEVKDPNLITSFLDGQQAVEWARKHMNGYELVVPPHLTARAWEFMQDDVSRFYADYQVSVQKRKKMCLALERTSQQTRFKSKGESYSNRFDGAELQLIGDTFSGFVLDLNAFYMSGSKLPLVDRTGYDGKIDLVLNADLSDVASLNKALAAYDLRLVEREAPINCLVIADKINAQP